MLVFANVFYIAELCNPSRYWFVAPLVVLAAFMTASGTWAWRRRRQ